MARPLRTSGARRVVVGRLARVGGVAVVADDGGPLAPLSTGTSTVTLATTTGSRSSLKVSTDGRGSAKVVEVELVAEGNDVVALITSTGAGLLGAGLAITVGARTGG